MISTITFNNSIHLKAGIVVEKGFVVQRNFRIEKSKENCIYNIADLVTTTMGAYPDKRFCSDADYAATMRIHFLWESFVGV